MNIFRSRANTVGAVGAENMRRKGLPEINYMLPMVVTLLATVVVFLVLAFVSTVMVLNSITQLGRMTANDPNASGATFGLCGVTGLLGLAATVYFFLALIKAVRDLFAPVYYTRGTVSDKRIIGGRKSGTWIGVRPDYGGPDRDVASQVSDGRGATFGTRSGGPSKRGETRKPSTYLSADRISAPEEDKPRPRRIFRIDPVAHAALDQGDTVLVAHSRFLEHIFYVARLSDGDWEVYENKALI